MKTTPNRPEEYSQAEIVSLYYSLLESEDLSTDFRELLPRNFADRQALYRLAANRHYDVQDAIAALLWRQQQRYRSLLVSWGSTNISPDALSKPGREHLVAMLPRMRDVLYRLVPHVINDHEYDLYQMHPQDRADRSLNANQSSDRVVAHGSD